MSTALGAVVVIGGVDSVTSQPTPTLHLYRFGQGWFAPVLRGEALGTVLAAVYSSTDRSIWVLATPSEGKIRLSRIDPFEGLVSLAGEYEWNSTTHDAFGLGVDAFGNALLSSASSHGTRLATLALSKKRAMACTLNTLEGRHDGRIFATRDEVSLVAVDTLGRVSGVRRIEELTPISLSPLTEMFK